MREKEIRAVLRALPICSHRPVRPVSRRAKDQRAPEQRELKRVLEQEARVGADKLGRELVNDVVLPALDVGVPA